MVRETDYIQQLANYVKRNLSKGYTVDTLRWALIKQGRSRAEVERAIMIAQKQMAAEAPKFEKKPVVVFEKKEEKKERGEFFQKIWKNLKEYFGVEKL